jgi:hypothetical protein
MEVGNGRTRHMPSNIHSDYDGIEVTRPPRTSPSSYPSAFVEPEDKYLSLGDIVELIADGTGHLLLGSDSISGRNQQKPSRRGSHNLMMVSSNSVGSSVRFGNLHIREYERALGDTPCSAGPPISIGWRYRVFDKNRGRYSAEFIYNDRADNATTEVILPIEKYEQLRGPRAPVRDLILSRFTREALLIENGVARVDLVEAVRQNIKVKNQRRQTITNLPFAPVEETIEKWSRQFKKLTIIDSSKRQQAKTRYLFDQWVDGSQRSGSANNGTFLSNARQQPSSTKGILVKDPEARRKEKLNSTPTPPSNPNNRASFTTSTSSSKDVSLK